MTKRFKNRQARTGVRIGIIAAIVAMIGATMLLPARASTGGGADIVETYIPNNGVYDPTLWFPFPSIDGLASADTTRVTVALQNKANGLWWQPDDSCNNAGNFPTCPYGELGPKWEKNPAMLLDGNPGGPVTFSFAAQPPDGTYMIGIKAYDDYGNSGRSIWREIRFETSTPETVNADLAPPLPANTYNTGAPFSLEGSLPSSDAEALVGIYNRDIGRWVDPSGNALSAKERFSADLTGDDVFGFGWNLRLDLPPGRYAYGADVLDGNGVRVSGTPWTYFTVRDCSNRCANVSLNAASVSFDQGGVCFDVTSNGRVDLALRNDDTGQWLQSTNPVTFGRSWTQFNNLTTLIQAGPDQRSSCFNDAPLDLPAGNYHLGVKTSDGDGNQGPKAWFGFAVR